MTIQSSRFPHPDDQTNAGRIATMKAQFITLCEELKRREGDRVKDVVMTLLPWIVENDWEYPIQAMNSQLEALDHNSDMEDVAAMRRGE
jgi:hypothetical protein